MHIDQRQGPVGDHMADSLAHQQLRRGLGRGNLPVSRKSRRRAVVRGTSNPVRPGLLAGALHFDVAQNQRRFAGAVPLDRDHRRRIADRETDAVIERPVGCWDAGEERGGHGKEDGHSSPSVGEAGVNAERFPQPVGRNL